MFRTVTLTLMQGFATTFEIFAMTLVLSLPLGLLIAFGLMNKWTLGGIWDFLVNDVIRGCGKKPEPGSEIAVKKRILLPRWLGRIAPISAICNFVVWIVRGTPLMLQLIIIFYGPGLWWDTNPWSLIDNNRVIATIVAFSFNYACYFSVIYKGGIEGVPKGQQEAGQVLGMTKWQIFKDITLLQMVKRIVPPMSNEIITLVKDTSLARIISAYEITQAGYAFIKSDGLMWPLYYTGLFYLVFVGLLTILFGYIEKRLDYFR